MGTLSGSFLGFVFISSMKQLGCWTLKNSSTPQLSSGHDSLERARMIHLNIEDSAEMPTSLLQLKVRRMAFVKACLSSAFLIIAAALFVVSMNRVFGWNLGKSNQRTRNDYHGDYLKMGSNETIAMHLRRLTDEPHVAGTAENFATAEYVLSTFKKYGLSDHAYYKDYNVLLSYPLSRSLTLRSPGVETLRRFELREKEVKGDPYSSRSSKAIPSFHAYSPSGTSVAEVVYVNHGRAEDFRALERMSVNVTGTIVIARHGKIFRGDIVKNSARAGASAVVIYSDPSDFAGTGSEGNYPLSKWLPRSGVQRGTVFQEPGDPQSPGWPSGSTTRDSERLPANDLKAVLPSIPSLPISAEDAQVIMNSLGGPLAPPHWHGGLDLPAYRIGPGPGILNFTYVENQTTVAIRNVFAVIKGLDEPDRYVLLGNHRDAWTFGAVDPNSGTATLLDIARRLGKLVEQGWKPRRSIVLCSWDAEEYGSVGSTEWVEENYNLLYSRAVAYINVDCAVAGPGFIASATPQLDNLLREATKQVVDPDDAAQTVYESWFAANKKSETAMIGRLGGGGSDFTSFLHHVGVPAIDIYYGNDYPVYHSLYDNYMWMEKFGDPHFRRHVAVAGIWGIIALKLCDEDILPFNYENYADELQSYTVTLEAQLKALGTPTHVSTSPLHDSISDLRMAISENKIEKKGLQEIESQFGDFQYWIPQRRAFNDRLLMAERAFTDSEGLPGKSWNKHLIYGETNENEYNSSSFPAIFESLQKAAQTNASKQWLALQHEIWRVSRAIDRAARVLHGQLT